jgi:hypothetical protein
MNRRSYTKHLISLFVLACFLTMAVGTSDSGGGTSSTSSSQNSSKQWFQGGTLHQATAAQWKAATYENKLATASDWLAATTWKGHLNSPRDFDRLKGKAQLLVNGVDEVINANPTGVVSPAEVAATIVTIANDLGP